MFLCEYLNFLLEWLHPLDVLPKMLIYHKPGEQDCQVEKPGVNKKPKKIKTVWHGFRGILKLSGRANQASLKLSAGFSNTVCWTS